MNVQELTGHEIHDVEEAIGMSFGDAAEAGSVFVGYGVYWIERRRTDPSYTYDQALSETLETVQEAIVDDEAPLDVAGNGEASLASADSGA